MKAWSIAWKDITIFLKDRGAIVYLFLLPLLFIVVMSGALSAVGQSTPQPTRIALPVVDLDGGEAARSLVQALDAAGGVRVEAYEQDVAVALLREGKLGRVLTIPSGFTANLAADRPSTLRLVNHPDADPEKNEAVRVVVEGVARDMALQSQILASLRQMGEMLADAPPEYQEAFSTERAVAQARSQFEASAKRPLVEVRQCVPAITSQPQEATTPGLNLTAVPGLAVLFVFLTAQATAYSIHEEKKIGSFRRLLAAPLSKASLLLGKMLPNLVTALLQMAAILAFGAFGLRLLGLTPVSLGRDPLALSLVVLLIALCSSALGLTIAALARTEGQVGGISQVLLWVMAILGGSIIPLFALEMYLGPLPRIVPHYWANRALDNLMLRGLTLAGVGTEMIVLLGFTILFFAIGLWRFEFD